MAAAQSCISSTSEDALWRPDRRRTTFAELPAELRLKIWSCAVEPRVVILDDLVQQEKSYPLPSVTQLNAESRTETRQGYEPAGRGSCFDFSRDILVCDPKISDQRFDLTLEDLALRVQRLAFWDCFPDDGRIDVLYHYSAYLQACYPSGHSGKIEFDKFWFPNLKDLWIVKVGEVDRSWMVGVDKDLPCEARLQKTARQFRYWVDEDIIEIASLDLSEPETKMILREGRCGKTDCQQLNLGRQRMVSKVVFVDGKYDGGLSKDEHQRWNRIRPWPTVVEQGATDTDTSANRMRWIIVERILTFSLRWDEPEELDHQDSLDHRRSRRTENTG
ncbi:uncharacterized protein UV8b_02136 [Ustilaginoidea virens]|uniref:2EXR domain-containing protein n=1 Tax=Ustilaginoidea virens TaxID=1159556 RepID=A0A063BYN6_USTVR|nr:uncharacterized protein UV8b_02136 [Ustilaginoidea virens]QUC17895.1 hypothetical protein UV8b_02136 [Ustilaginoidea virens]GAO19393.1 hypothetical protein UVI_02052720 [Ustilaginoidea virens]